ncbi:MAG: DUF108 domain-containing protein [Actinomyces sp.]|jgi:aspartate dehydrogenase|nr:aspartate dehydrogenase domain-containing protein [Actinomyces sp.]MCI1787570.1 DUF108 domain-containing protein [Actinomyces sp.]MCI1830222.1 DUF108 domain-containing protein [Actinomyces sp.]
MTEHGVAIHGLGTIGTAVAAALLDGEKGLRLTAVSTRHPAKVRQWLSDHGAPAGIVVGTPDDAARTADIVVEASGLAGFGPIARAASEWRRIFVPSTVGGLLEHGDLLRDAGRVLIPSGAIGGLDLIRAAQASRSIRRLHIETRKPAVALPNKGRKEPAGAVRLFSGTVREGYSLFPANVNVAVACALAGPGPDNTTLEVWRDPTMRRNTHVVSLESAEVTAQIRVENTPSENPRTGLVASSSLLALLRQYVGVRQFL